jgi:hypothetical protein
MIEILYLSIPFFEQYVTSEGVVKASQVEESLGLILSDAARGKTHQLSNWL